jgi:hypothetical protein
MMRVKKHSRVAPELSGYGGIHRMDEAIYIERTKALVVRKDFLDLTALVRSVQRAEGLPDCFRQPAGGCDRSDCTWRKYCME